MAHTSNRAHARATETPDTEPGECGLARAYRVERRRRRLLSRTRGPAREALPNGSKKPQGSYAVEEGALCWALREWSPGGERESPAPPLGLHGPPRRRAGAHPSPFFVADLLRARALVGSRRSHPACANCARPTSCRRHQRVARPILIAQGDGDGDCGRTCPLGKQKELRDRRTFLIWDDGIHRKERQQTDIRIQCALARVEARPNGDVVDPVDRGGATCADRAIQYPCHSGATRAVATPLEWDRAALDASAAKRSRRGDRLWCSVDVLDKPQVRELEFHAITFGHQTKTTTKCSGGRVAPKRDSVALFGCNRAH